MSLPNELYNAKFAEYLDSIKIMYLVDDRFKMICDDYCISKINAEKFRKKIERDFQHQLKHENLSKELEDEILIYIIKKL